MKWVKLIGGRFLDFLITSAVVTLLCVGVVLIGEHYERRQRSAYRTGKRLSQQRIDELDRKYMPVEPTDQQLEPAKRDLSNRPEPEKKTMTPEERKRIALEGLETSMTPEERLKRLRFTKEERRKRLLEGMSVESRLPDEQGIMSRLTTPRAIRNSTRVLSVAIGLFGVISVFGIVFRREGLTQREGFVRVWVGVPKYFNQYFAGYFRKSKPEGE